MAGLIGISTAELAYQQQQMNRYAREQLDRASFGGALGSIGQGIGQAGLAQQGMSYERASLPSPPSERVAFKREPEGIREELQDEVNDWLKDIN